LSDWEINLSSEYIDWDADFVHGHVFGLPRAPI